MGRPMFLLACWITIPVPKKKASLKTHDHKQSSRITYRALPHLVHFLREALALLQYAHKCISTAFGTILLLICTDLSKSRLGIMSSGNRSKRSKRASSDFVLLNRGVVLSGSRSCRLSKRWTTLCHRSLAHFNRSKITWHLNRC